MNVSVVEIKPGDQILASFDIQNMYPTEADKYINEMMSSLREIFGCEVSIVPRREPGFDLVVIRKHKPEKEIL